uniref:Uncharacterized protein n=1 Tax=Arundo donax TaxID=35708 RepID=A0A0A9E600_ARUDO
MQGLTILYSSPGATSTDFYHCLLLNFLGRLECSGGGGRCWLVLLDISLIFW